MSDESWISVAPIPLAGSTPDCTLTDFEQIDGIQIPKPSYRHEALVTTNMRGMAYANDLINEAQRRGAQAGDTVRGMYKPDADGRMVLDPQTVTIERPDMSEPGVTVTP